MDPAQMATQEWSTYTARQGFGVQGIHCSSAGVTSVARSHKATSDCAFVATTENNGMLKLFSFPSLQENSEFKAYQAHSSRAVQSTFSYDDKYLVSVGGGKDRSILVWATDFQGFKAKMESQKLKVKDFTK